MALFVVGRPDAPAEGGGLLSSIYEWLPADLLNIPLPGSFCFRLQKSRVAELLLGLAAGCVIGQMLLSYDDRTCIVAEGEVEADEMKPGGRRLGGGGSKRILRECASTAASNVGGRASSSAAPKSGIRVNNPNHNLPRSSAGGRVSGKKAKREPMDWLHERPPGSK